MKRKEKVEVTRLSDSDRKVIDKYAKNFTGRIGTTVTRPVMKNDERDPCNEMNLS